LAGDAFLKSTGLAPPTLPLRQQAIHCSFLNNPQTLLP